MAAITSLLIGGVVQAEVSLCHWPHRDKGTERFLQSPFSLLFVKGKANLWSSELLVLLWYRNTGSLSSFPCSPSQNSYLPVSLYTNHTDCHKEKWSS